MIKDKDLKIVDVKFTDLFGEWQHFSMPVEEFSEEGAFEEGMGFDGSSIRGFQSIESSDMILLADPDSAMIDPVYEMPTLSLTCDVYDPITRAPYSRDPRYIAKKAVEYLQGTGIADTAYIGPEAEFFIFDKVMYSAGEYSSAYEIDSIEGPWNNGIFGFGHSVPHKRGYFPVPPLDTLQDMRSEMVRTLIDSGVDIELHHHEVGTAGQCEIDMQIQAAGAHGRPGADLQVHCQERGQEDTARPPPSCPSRSTPTTAPACIPTRACGRTASRSLPATATPG